MNLTTEHVWTEAELMALPKDEGKHELVDGKLVVIPLYGLGHVEIITRLMFKLYEVVRKHHLGHVLGSRLGCWMKNGNLRCPDVPFVLHKRIKGQDPKAFLKGAPDLVAEVVPRSGSIEAMREKAVDYLESGCRLVWIVDPDSRSVTVLRPDGTQTTVTDTLSGEDVIPGFSLAVNELFDDLVPL